MSALLDLAGSVGMWRILHRWSSLACTLFLLLLCMTGLPLIFSDEIESFTQSPTILRGPAVTAVPNDVDGMIQVAVNRYPAEMVRFVFFDDDEGRIKVVMGPADLPDRSHDHPVIFDTDSGALIDEPISIGNRGLGFMATARRLHTDLLVGFAGEMTLAVAGVVFLLATISGVVLYGPYMKKLSFGTIRQRNRRIWWLDLHNLLGVAIAIWLIVVGATGVMNEFSKPLSAIWRTAESSKFQNKDGRPLTRSQSSPAEQVLNNVRSAQPYSNVTSIIFPSKTFNNPNHFLVWSNGRTPLTHRLFSAVFVDARSGQVASISPMPLQLRILQLSRPLHFGDYGGLPLKILWACLDVIAMLVLISGILLTVKKKK